MSKFIVDLGNFVSLAFDIDCGVPQGRVLGLILFSFFSIISQLLELILI